MNYNTPKGIVKWVIYLLGISPILVLLALYVYSSISHLTISLIIATLCVANALVMYTVYTVCLLQK